MCAFNECVCTYKPPKSYNKNVSGYQYRLVMSLRPRGPTNSNLAASMGGTMFATPEMATPARVPVEWGTVHRNTPGEPSAELSPGVSSHNVPSEQQHTDADLIIPGEVPIGPDDYDINPIIHAESDKPSLGDSLAKKLSQLTAGLGPTSLHLDTDAAATTLTDTAKKGTRAISDLTVAGNTLVTNAVDAATKGLPNLDSVQNQLSVVVDTLAGKLGNMVEVEGYPNPLIKPIADLTMKDVFYGWTLFIVQTIAFLVPLFRSVTGGYVARTEITNYMNTNNNLFFAGLTLIFAALFIIVAYH